MNLERRGETVHDLLMARAVVLESNGRKIAIASCDLGGLRAAIVEKVRALIHEATGIEPARVMVTATHTHSAPVVAQWIGVGREDANYLSNLPGKIAQAVIVASSRMEPTDIAYGEAAVQGVSRNREYPNGPLDPKVSILKFTRGNGTLAGFIANYSVHPVVKRRHGFTLEIWPALQQIRLPKYFRVQWGFSCKVPVGTSTPFTPICRRRNPSKS